MGHRSAVPVNYASVTCASVSMCMLRMHARWKKYDYKALSASIYRVSVQRCVQEYMQINKLTVASDTGEVVQDSFDCSLLGRARRNATIVLAVVRACVCMQTRQANDKT